ncbi:Crp/Fnr family transcriptional regulator [Bradyrhizobium sp. AZCC 1721]|uniref:Crp/Fnr family transcriptional regulator n=1 Tax=Bradyrhizobium sp. AZCC 1721 TaxID=3117016 RepID=UPI002FF265A8
MRNWEARFALNNGHRQPNPVRSEKGQTRKFPIFATLLPCTCESRLGAGVTSLQLRADATAKRTRERAIAEFTARGKIDCTETAGNLTQTVVIRLQLSVSGISDEYRRLCAEDDPMESSSADSSTILDRILDAAADNLRIAKILVQMGLDPNNITYDALFNRLLEIVLANITLANMFALVGAIFLVATLLMHTMVPLRVANMAGCTFFVAFGALSGNVGTFILYLLLLPINAIRLRQMLNLIKRARIATEGDTSLEWLKPFMTERKYRSGDKLFKKDDAATEMFLTVTGKFLVTEISVEIPPGRLMGELGFLTPNKRRTATVECIEDGQVLTITYERLLEIYFQNPQFGYYFLVLTSQRLLENISRLEGIIAQEKAARQTLATDDIA